MLSGVGSDPETWETPSPFKHLYGGQNNLPLKLLGLVPPLQRQPSSVISC